MKRYYCHVFTTKKGLLNQDRGILHIEAKTQIALKRSIEYVINDRQSFNLLKVESIVVKCYTNREDIDTNKDCLYCFRLTDRWACEL